MAWWQKKILRYALSRTGLLDDKALDPNNLDITLGKRNVVELKDLGLNIKRISKLAQLPPGLRIETARILSLRLTVPADIYQSSIVAEVDGVELKLRFEEREETVIEEHRKGARSPLTTRSPQHRKVHNRIQSPSIYDPGGISNAEDAYLPSTRELAKSFLLEEPAQERREIEASFAVSDKALDESIVSESSDGSEIGFGASMGLPGFLANFLQGIVDRFQIVVKNIEASLETEVAGDGSPAIPLTLRLHVGSAELKSANADADDEKVKQGRDHSERQSRFTALSLHLLSDAAVFSDMSELPSRASPAESRRSSQSPLTSRSSAVSPKLSSNARALTTSAYQSPGSVGSSRKEPRFSPEPDPMHASILTADLDRFADAGDDASQAGRQSMRSDLDIQPGDDNVSWGSRRSKSDAPAGDLWSSMVSEDDLPDSLLVERIGNAHARPSAASSPTLLRDRRAASPYRRSLQSPGSWPRLEESPERSRYHQGPGSWPLMDEDELGSLRLPARSYMPSTYPAIDNKRNALEASLVASEEVDTTSEISVGSAEDLSTSRVFTHEDAESMYVSAMSQSVKMHVPGGWGSEDSQGESILAPRPSRLPPSNRQGDLLSSQVTLDNDSAYNEASRGTPGNVTPRAASPPPSGQPAPAGWTSPAKASRQIVYIDFAIVTIPAINTAQIGEERETGAQATASMSLHHNDMPGTFSAYSERSAFRQKTADFSKQDSSSTILPSAEQLSAHEQQSQAKLNFGYLKCQLDMACVRLLHRLTTKFSTAFLAKTSSDTRDKDSSANGLSLDLSISDFNVVFKESAARSLDKASPVEPGENLVSIVGRLVSLSSKASNVNMRMGSLAFFIGPSCVLSFDRHSDAMTSMIITEQSPDIAVLVDHRSNSSKRPILDVTINILPAIVFVDLAVIEQTFEPFGGLSGILEIGSSVLSASGATSPSLSATKRSKGVRFEEGLQPSDTQTEVKFNGRVGGLSAMLQGASCSMEMRTTTLKAIYREQGAVLTLEQVTISGPHVAGSQSEDAMTIDLSTLRLEYLLSPQDKDLERLLSLITPSKDKYDNDDDILLDTLLRQRKKGAVARVSVSQVAFQVGDWSCVESLSRLGDELGKLSAVTEYLPEDDRPGLLTLIRVKEFDAQVPVNNRFGLLKSTLIDFHCAHVGLPALLALSLGDITLTQAGQGALVHSFVPLSGSENLPMVMARMLGNELEPTIKVKLFNTCVEYSVPIILALTNMDEEAGAEAMVSGMASSVANLALSADRTITRNDTVASDTSNVAAKKLKVEILVHDSAVGLSPQNLPSKALLVLTDAHITVTNPETHVMKAGLQLRKAGIFVTDQAIMDESDTITTTRASPNNTATKAKLTGTLAKRGYVSVGSIMAAHAVAHITKPSDSETQTVDVELRNELLLLETCADSTQSLIATLSGLVPPSAPSKQPKYQTEPMTIEDMMASFTGDAFEKPKRPPETLFDVEEEPDDDPVLSLDVPTLNEDDDDLLAESEMTSSLYGPVSGILDGLDQAKDDDEDEDYSETVESLLEDDPFEMTIAPAEAGLSDGALLRELNTQSKYAVSSQPLDLGLEEYEDVGFDALGGNQSALGNRFRFNTSANTKRKAMLRKDARNLPFSLKMRDVHVIWNIYDGYDWQATREGISQAVEQVELRAEERKAKRRQSSNEREDDESVIGDFLFNSIYIGVPSGHEAQELRRQINREIDDLASETESAPISGMSKPTTVQSASGRPIRPRSRKRLRLERSKAHKIAFELKGVCADIVVFPPDTIDVVSSVDVRVRDFEIFDNVPTSTWRKFLTHLSDEPGDREMSKPMLHLELFNVRTLENFAASEIVLHVSLLPLRLHVDQDALDFVTRFFEFKDTNAVGTDTSSNQPFLQRVEVDTVDLRLDYKPKKVDYGGLRSGHTDEFMNFIILDAANIRLKHAIIYGIKGFEPLHKTLNDIWMPDVKRNQLPTVLAGLAPVRSLVNIGSGIRDVVAIPIREYQKDGRIVRSIQKGAFQFGKTTASELARLGAKVAIGTQNLLQGAEGFLTPPPSSSPGRPGSTGRHSLGNYDDDPNEEERERRAISAYANQPLGVLAGLRSAQRHLEYDLLTARDAFIAVQGEILESDGAGAAAAAIVRHAPTIILRPIIGTSRAVGTALLGAGNQIDRDNVRRTEDKYKRR